jgi:hypothetical protein
MCLYSSERELGLVCSGSSVLHFEFQPAFLVHARLTGHSDVHFRLAPDIPECRYCVSLAVSVRDCQQRMQCQYVTVSNVGSVSR